MEPASTQPDQMFSTSKLYMWRCVIAMAHADGIVTPEEQDYLETIFGNMRKRAGLNEEQHGILQADLKEPQDVGMLLSHINDPAYRAQVVYFARLLAWKDGELHPSEEALLQKLNAYAMDRVDLDTVRQTVQENVQSEMTLHDIEVDANRPEVNLLKGRGLFALLDMLALHFDIDLMRD